MSYSTGKATGGKALDLLVSNLRKKSIQKENGYLPPCLCRLVVLRIVTTISDGLDVTLLILGPGPGKDIKETMLL